MNTILYLRTDLGNDHLVAGGSVTHTLGVIQGFIDNHYHVVIASTALHTVLPEKFSEHIILLHIPRWMRVLGTKVSSVCSASIFVWPLLKIIKKYKPCVLYHRYSLLNVTGVLLRIITGIPLILEYNGSEVWIEQCWTRGQWLRLSWLLWIIEQLNLRTADTIVVVSRALRTELLDAGISGDKIVVNPNGVDAQRYYPAIPYLERAALLRHQYGIEPTAIVFGFIGTFNYWHGIELLTAMMPLVVTHCPQAYFLCIGTGPLWSHMHTGIQMHGLHKRIFCPGLVPHDQALSYLAACDVFLCPTQPNPDGTEFFGSPTKLFEYMSFAKPVIASNLGQMSEIINPAAYATDQMITVPANACGILVPPTDVHAFVYAAQTVYGWSESQRQTMGACARARIIQEYTWNHHVKRIIKQLPTR